MALRESTAMRYKAFLSYSHRGDGRLAASLQRGLQAFARPFFRARSMRIFRDFSDLSASPQLWTSVQRALESSEYLILCASPESARSPWVQREVEWWLQERGTESLLLVLTAGEIQPLVIPGRSFTLADNGTLPTRLCDAIAAEPRFVDLRWARESSTLSLRHSAFRRAILDLAAILLAKDKAELDSEEVRSFRLQRLLLALGVGSLIVFAVLASFQWLVARQRLASLKIEISREASLRGDPAEAARAIGVINAGYSDLEGRVVKWGGEEMSSVAQLTLIDDHQGADFEPKSRFFYMWGDYNGKRYFEQVVDLARARISPMGNSYQEPSLDAAVRIARHLEAIKDTQWLSDSLSSERWKISSKPGEIWYRNGQTRFLAGASPTQVRLMELPRARDSVVTELCAVPRSVPGFEDNDLQDEDEQGSHPVVSFNPDGASFAVGGFPAKLWGLSSCRPIASIPLSASYPEAVWFSRNGRYIATQGYIHVGSGSGVVTVFRAPRSRILLRWTGSEAQLIAQDKKLRIVEAEGAREWTIASLLNGDIDKSILLRSGGAIASLGRDGKQAVWVANNQSVELLSGESLNARCDFPSEAKGMAWWVLSPSGRFVVARAESSFAPLRVYSGARCQHLYDLDEFVPHAGQPVFGPGDDDLVVLGNEMQEGTGAVFRVAVRWHLYEKMAVKSEIGDSLENPDDDTSCRICGTQADDEGFIVDPSPDGTTSTVRNLFANDGSLDMTLDGHVQKIAVPSKSRIVLGWSGRAVGIWSIATGRQLAALEGHHAEVVGGEISEDGRVAVSWDTDGEVIVWQVW